MTVTTTPAVASSAAITTAAAFFACAGKGFSPRRPVMLMAERSQIKTWTLTHLTRLWTALATLAGLGAAFVYRPDLLTLYLRTTMTAIETATAALPYPWGDRAEVILRGIGGSVWMQFAFAIVLVRVMVW
jgi:hypothetical protein